MSARRRLIEFMDEFGLNALEPLADEIIGRSERAMRDGDRALPDGVYEHDGLLRRLSRSRCDLQCAIRMRATSCMVDWAGSSPESRRGINVVLNYTHAYTTYALNARSRPDVPNNEGSFRPVTVTAPPRSILNASRPAPVAARHVIGHFLPGSLFRRAGRGAAGPRYGRRRGEYLESAIHRADLAGSIPSPMSGSLAAAPARGRPRTVHATAFPSGIAGVPAEVIENPRRSSCGSDRSVRIRVGRAVFVAAAAKRSGLDSAPIDHIGLRRSWIVSTTRLRDTTVEWTEPKRPLSYRPVKL